MKYFGKRLLFLTIPKPLKQYTLFKKTLSIPLENFHKIFGLKIFIRQLYDRGESSKYDSLRQKPNWVNSTSYVSNLSRLKAGLNLKTLYKKMAIDNLICLWYLNFNGYRNRQASICWPPAPLTARKAYRPEGRTVLISSMHNYSFSIHPL